MSSHNMIPFFYTLKKSFTPDLHHNTNIYIKRGERNPNDRFHNTITYRVSCYLGNERRTHLIRFAFRDSLFTGLGTT